MAKPVLASHAFGKRDGNGGQQRVWAVEGALVDVFGGFERLMGVWPSSFDWIAGDPQLAFLRSGIVSAGSEEWDYTWWAHEYYLGLRLGMQDAARTRTRELLRGTDFLVVDHLWMWPLLRRTILEIGWMGRVVYMSHNAEALARLDYMRLEGTVAGEAWATVQAIERCEVSLALASDLIIACSEADADWYRQRTDTEVVVVENGAWAHDGDVDQEFRGVGSYSLFAASDWHPNLDGFREIILPALERCWEPQRVIVTGTAANALRESVQRSAVLWPVGHSVELLGDLGADEFRLVVERAAAFLIPIRIGSGSNIKSAEALVNGKSVIATSKGMRGFELWAQDHPGWHVADSVSAWVSAFSAPMNAAVHPRIPELGWSHIRDRLANAVAVWALEPGGARVG